MANALSMAAVILIAAVCHAWLSRQSLKEQTVKSLHFTDVETEAKRRGPLPWVSQTEMGALAYVF
jgi:hypothetical protein